MRNFSNSGIQQLQNTATCPNQNPDFLQYCVVYFYELAKLTLSTQIIPNQHQESYKNSRGIIQTKTVNTPSNSVIQAVLDCLQGGTTNTAFFNNITASNASVPCSATRRAEGLSLRAAINVEGLSAEACEIVLQKFKTLTKQCSNETKQQQLWALFSLCALLFVIIPAVYAAYQTCANRKNFCDEFKKAAFAPVRFIGKVCSKGSRRSNHHERSAGNDPF